MLLFHSSVRAIEADEGLSSTVNEVKTTLAVEDIRGSNVREAEEEELMNAGQIEHANGDGMLLSHSSFRAVEADEGFSSTVNETKIVSVEDCRVESGKSEGNIKDDSEGSLTISWFQWDEIHETEKRELGEFFDGSSFSRNPRVYKEYRDFIINKYREDASRRLTFTEVRRSLVGDVGSIHRVFLFLDRWGLINFSTSDGDRAAAAGIDSGGGAFSVALEDGPPSTVKVVPSHNSSKGLSAQLAFGSKVVETGSSFRLPPLTSYSDVFSQQTPLAGRVCGDCGEECISGYYESQSGIVICVKCFENERSGPGKRGEGYKFYDQKIDSAKHLANQWTDRETLSLLEAIVSKGPDWDLIANHVRRSRLDCIGKLIQLPFGEHMGTHGGKFDQRNSMSQQGGESVKCTLPDMFQQESGHESDDIAPESTGEPPRKRKPFPSLGDASDSLVEQVASLSALAGPHVASAAAEAVISALCEEHPYAKKVFTLECKTGRSFSHSMFRINAATATAFGAVAARARLLADQEERQIECLMASIIDLQLESIMEEQYAQIQQLKEDILQEWIDISQRALSAGIPRWKDHGLPKSLPNRSSIT
ncbi:unnamed protein product [Spirodela intermedia]|uniref:Uncharacterized protein n=1 Tax=Spirodela intermedia TaxID=51605 RepID=A0A7I8J3S0_SPIIN|nr:unnamed protein product [Spirodela intermedia]CAA6664031.1 unnamed protein product [Spirodela intermedia]